MNGKWIKVSALVAALLVALLATATAVSAQGPYGPGMRGGFGGPQNSLVAVAAKVLGLEQSALVAELNSGKTIADVAKEKGVSLDTIVDAFVAARADALKNAVASGRLTQTQADAMLAQMRANVTAQLNAKFQPRGYGMGQGFVDANNDGVCDNCGANGTNRPNRPGGRWGR